MINNFRAQIKCQIVTPLGFPKDERRYNTRAEFVLLAQMRTRRLLAWLGGHAIGQKYGSGLLSNPETTLKIQTSAFSMIKSIKNT